MPYDLFGEIPVLEDEVYQWVAAVAPRWLHPESAYLRYVRSWDVPAKIRAAKAAGTFHQTIEKPSTQWHARLALSAVL
ncbi:hypothetical protein RY831_27625 [Noviherbaspirillum sp. CPCC 100848]|uniref:Uncharacterized protein n=1 Tax=Noviherbaspirillum album TaxID=3080276 RepID=A0ABU6JGZ2_9BURK|nr:hypothetical protein [Noviherbaspirillum sp. CPCC 100848]MEC4722934.1 hypothetical protein [Noviherbaspirillum sp. CPCC 100848]